MPKLRSATTTEGRNMAGARALWRATGVCDSDFGKPMVAVVNSYTQFVPGHVHLREPAEWLAAAIREHGGIPREFNTIAIDDGIAMGHEGMLYSLPSRELIADSVEYMVKAHCVDAMVCVSNCDKITPGMLMAALRLNIPAIFVSGGPMEAGRASGAQIDLVDAMVGAADPRRSDEQVVELEQNACPTCGSCAGMFTANSMNCLLEALGLALPGNGSLLATHRLRRRLFEQAGQQIMALCQAYYQHDDSRVLPREIVNLAAFENAMRLDVAMGGSTNTILHLLAAANEADVGFNLTHIERISRQTPYLCQVAPATARYHMEYVHRAGGVMAILAELQAHGQLETACYTVSQLTLGQLIGQYGISQSRRYHDFYRAAPAGVRTLAAASQRCYYPDLDLDREKGCIRRWQNAYATDGGLAVLYGNLAPNGAVVKTAAVSESQKYFTGEARVFESQEQAVDAILTGQIKPGQVLVIRFEGPKGGPGMQEMLYPTSYLKSMGLDQSCALITDGRFSGGSSGLSVGHISPEAASGGMIALVEDGDLIEIDIGQRRLQLLVEESLLAKRLRQRQSLQGSRWQPGKRSRQVSKALQFYALTATSADQGGVRRLTAELA